MPLKDLFRGPKRTLTKVTSPKIKAGDRTSDSRDIGQEVIEEHKAKALGSFIATIFEDLEIDTNYARRDSDVTVFNRD